jgi:predicted metal-dependent hydrolase
MFFKRVIIRRRVTHPDKAKIIFRDGQMAGVMGKPFVISVIEEPNATYSTARAKDGVVTVKLSGDLRPAQKEKHTSNLARRAIARAILPHVEERVRHFNDLHFKAELGAVRLKDNVSNWGSCSRMNNINLDFRLLFGPQDILDAVIVHELAHTKHRNHSKEFHNTVHAIMPDNKQKLRWLRDNGAKLGVQSGDINYQNSSSPTQMQDKPIWALDS